MSIKVIAEIGCNHRGRKEIAIDMIIEAAKCGANYAKFQKRNPKECLRPEVYNGPHPNPTNSYGLTYGEHREALEFDIDVHAELKEICIDNHIEYNCTPFDLTSAKEVIELGTKVIKISSFHNNHPSLLKYIFDNHPDEIHISLGMTTKKELEDLINLSKSYSRQKDIVLFWCTSAYPCPPSQLYLNEIKNLFEKYNNVFKAIGLSGHHDGISMDLIALTYGARYFERHFTLDHNWKGTDHKVSLEPSGMTRLIRDLNSGLEALKYKPNDIVDIENHNRNFHKFIPKK